MAALPQSGGWSGPSRRRVPRFRMRAPLDVTMLRSGIPDTVPGRALNVCERGIAAIIAGELKTGETVGLEVRLSSSTQPLRTRATVRYQDKLRYGLEFTAMSAEQRNAIRDWAKRVKAGAESKADMISLMSPTAEKGMAPGTNRVVGVRDVAGRGSNPKKLRQVWLLATVLLAIVAAIAWRQWNRSWEQLESGLKSAETASLEKPQAEVPAEVMQKLLVHRVEPVYPPEARKEHLEGIIALNVVVGRNGSVMNMHPLNGPDVLAQAAMDALRWWKFEPYRLNGEPAVVETTLAVEFKR